MLVINCIIYCTFKRVTKSGIFAYIEQVETNLLYIRSTGCEEREDIIKGTVFIDECKTISFVVYDKKCHFTEELLARE